MQLELVLVLQIVFAHWVSDFVLQSHWMATNKSKNWQALLAHVATYTASMTVLMFIMAILLSDTVIKFNMINGIILAMTPSAYMAWILLNGVLHLITDAVTSRITYKLWGRSKMHDFFVVVGFDQMIHYTCLFVTLWYMM